MRDCGLPVRTAWKSYPQLLPQVRQAALAVQEADHERPRVCHDYPVHLKTHDKLLSQHNHALQSQDARMRCVSSDIQHCLDPTTMQSVCSIVLAVTCICRHFSVCVRNIRSDVTVKCSLSSPQSEYFDTAQLQLGLSAVLAELPPRKEQACCQRASPAALHSEAEQGGVERLPGGMCRRLSHASGLDHLRSALCLQCSNQPGSKYLLCIAATSQLLSL